MDALSTEKLVLTEVELLARFEPERILHEPLTAGVAEIESHRPRCILGHPRVVAVIEVLEKILHFFKMIFVVAEVIEGTAARVILNGWKDLDPDHMPHIHLGMDRSLARIT